MGFPDKLELGNNAVGVRVRENFPGCGWREGWFFTYTTIGKTFSMGHPMSSFEPLLEQCLRRQARKSSSPDKKKTKKQNKRKESKTKWKEREEANRTFQTYQESFCFDLTVEVNNEPSEGNRERKLEVSKREGKMTRKIKRKAKRGYLSVGAD